MNSIYSYLLPAMWLAWSAYWLAMSLRAKAVARKEPVASRLLHIAPLAVAAWLVAAPQTGIDALDAVVVQRREWMYWTGAALTAAGLLFCVAARVTIGGNWSGIVTIKQGHELVSNGPYALVRHPIYTGLLLAFAGTALAWDQWRGVVAVLVVFATFWRKLRVEERYLTEQFGGQYADYRRRVAALIPFLL
jgi:protein-S-isoprenylcysteine O-methyltransferase Ste14